MQLACIRSVGEENADAISSPASLWDVMVASVEYGVMLSETSAGFCGVVNSGMSQRRVEQTPARGTRLRNREQVAGSQHQTSV